uniref:Complex III subunit VI n=2 Tax=Populus alba TaxID=43335 RepID=A0A4U5PTV8_POPAL|nr:ubiquinol-cytochrome C reductase complex 7.8 kDa family protein [Populus alba]
MSCRADNSVALAAPTRLVKSLFETAGGRKHNNPLCLEPAVALPASITRFSCHQLPTKRSRQFVSPCFLVLIYVLCLRAMNQDHGAVFLTSGMADEEPVDPKKYLEEACKPKCVRPLLEYQACVKRIQGDESGHKHCTGQYFDYWSCVDKCVAPKLFSKLK